MLNMKLKLLIVFLLLIILAFIAPKSYASSYKDIPFFDFSKPEIGYTIKKETVSASDVEIKIPRITMITVKKGSFTQDVNVSIYKGIWKILTAGPNKGNSPISAYYLAFLDSNGNEITPSKIVGVFAYNNYIGTKATFTPLKRGAGQPDRSSVFVFPNQTNVKVIMPQDDSGFIVTVNKEIAENDPSLIGIPNIPKAVPSVTPSKTGSILNQNLLLILAIVIVLILIAGIATYLMRKPSEENIQT